jgi:hypothetical protein
MVFASWLRILKVGNTAAAAAVDLRNVLRLNVIVSIVFSL